MATAKEIENKLNEEFKRLIQEHRQITQAKLNEFQTQQTQALNELTSDEGHLKDEITRLIADYAQETKSRLKEISTTQTKEVEELRQQIEKAYDDLRFPAEVVAHAMEKGSEEYKKDLVVNFTNLSASVRRIRTQSTQADILSALVESAALFAPRASIFLSRGDNIVGWEARGFSNNFQNEQIRSVSVSKAAKTLLKEAIENCSATDGNANSYPENSLLLRNIGGLEPEKILALPLVINKVAPAVLYVDSGEVSETSVNREALEILTITASLTIENVALSIVQEKVPGMRDVAQVAEQRMVKEQPIRGEEPPPPTLPPQTISQARQPIAQMTQSSMVGSQAEKEKSSREEEKQHFDAKRCARLAVTEIKLYNEQKVEEGRRSKDLYSKLKQEIERGREWYEKRVPVAVRTSADYYHNELVRILGENDITALGQDYPGPKIAAN